MASICFSLRQRKHLASSNNCPGSHSITDYVVTTSSSSVQIRNASIACNSPPPMPQCQHLIASRISAVVGAVSNCPELTAALMAASVLTCQIAAGPVGETFYILSNVGDALISQVGDNLIYQ